MYKYQIAKQGQYTDREKDGLKRFLEEAKALEARGPIDVAAMLKGELPEDLPGKPTVWEVKAEMMAYHSGKYDPDNKLYTDDEYARKMGYEGRIAMPTFAACDDLILTAFPMDCRDIMCVSSLDNSVEQLKPIYVGDTLYTVKDAMTIRDITPVEGGEYRNFCIMCYGSVYNQKGEKVLKVRFGATENLKTFDGEKPEHYMPWESPDWWARPEHKYTDEDYDKIIGIWKSEHVQGKTPLYWEDVEVGFCPTPTAEGPIESSASPTPPYGMGIGGSRTLRHELMDPDFKEKMIRCEETGIWYPRDPGDLTPTPPPHKRKGGPMDPSLFKDKEPEPYPTHANHRGIFINFIGRDYALRHINNFMGSHGWLKEIRWGIMTELKEQGYTFPMNDKIPNYVTLIPAANGKRLRAHGLQYDTMIIKSQVLEKYVENGEYLVKLGWWIETFEGDVFEHGDAIIKLPHRA